MSERHERRSYLTARGAAALRTRLTDRDLAIVRQVATLRLMSAAQIQAVYFPSEHGSAATRSRQRVLARLIRERLLVALARRVGGVRAGSTGLIVAAGPAAARVLRLPGRRHEYEPGGHFVEHTLARAQLIVDVMQAARADRLDLIDWQVEPQCWRTFTGQAERQLKPDAFLSLGVDEYVLDWFCEVDRATESLPTVMHKCRAYAAYYQTGAEQAARGVFPRVIWITPDEARAERIKRAIARGQFPERLFVVTTAERAINALTARE